MANTYSFCGTALPKNPNNLEWGNLTQPPTIGDDILLVDPDTNEYCTFKVVKVCKDGCLIYAKAKAGDEGAGGSTEPPPTFPIYLPVRETCIDGKPMLAYDIITSGPDPLEITTTHKPFPSPELEGCDCPE